MRNIVIVIIIIAVIGSFTLGYHIGQAKAQPVQEANERPHEQKEEIKAVKVNSDKHTKVTAQDVLNKKPYPDGSQYLTKDEWEILCAAAKSGL